MRKLCEVIIFLTSLFHHHPAHAQIATLTGNVNNINTVGQAGGIRVMQVIYELHSLGAGGVDQLGCGTGILPRVTGSGVALATTQWPYTPSGTGAMSGSIYRNDFIDCAGVTPTFYKVYMVNAGSKSLFGSFKIDSTTVVSGNFNFTTATGLTGASFITPVGTTPGAVLLNPAADQTITVGSLFMPSTKVLGWTDVAICRGGSSGFLFVGDGSCNSNGNIFATSFNTQNQSVIMNNATGLIVGSGGGVGSATFSQAGTATVSNNFGSTPINFKQSIWNGSSASTESWSLNAFENNSGTNPVSYFTILFNNQLSRTSQPGFLLQNASLATSGQNYGAPYLQFVSSYWNGAGSISDFWTLTPTLGTGTNPTSTLSLNHGGSSGLTAVQVPNLQITNLGSTTTPSIVWTGNGLANWGLNQDFGTGLIVTVENGLNTATLGHQIKFQSTGDVGWTSSNNATGSEDTVLYRDSPGVVAVGTTLHNAAGTLKAANLQVGTDTAISSAPRMVWGSFQGGNVAVWTFANPLASIVMDRAVTVTRFDVSTGGATTNCSVSPTVSVTDGTTPVTLTFTNGTGVFVPLDSGVVTQNYAAGATLRIIETTGTCTTPPSINNLAVEYKMQ